MAKLDEQIKRRGAVLQAEIKGFLSLLVRAGHPLEKTFQPMAYDFKTGSPELFNQFIAPAKVSAKTRVWGLLEDAIRGLRKDK